MLKPVRGFLSLVGLLITLCGCASHSDDLALTDVDPRFVVTYYDRNHDGIVDFELHRLPGGGDTDWALSDTKFRGRYDLRINWGYTFTKDRIDLSVPKDVKITPGDPQVVPTE